MRLATVFTPHGPAQPPSSRTLTSICTPPTPICRQPSASSSKATSSAAPGRPPSRRRPSSALTPRCCRPSPIRRKSSASASTTATTPPRAALPSRDPVLFSKYATSLIGPGASIRLPRVSNEVDYEAELVIVVGKRGRHVRAADAGQYVAGYTVGHDVSARDWQLKKDGKQWMVGKTFDTFAPTGPHLVTADEVPDPHALPVRLRLNGQTMQDSNTSQMIFAVPFVIAYLSQVFTLEPGDLIFTGTPPGVGMARKPPVFLKGGDVVEIEIGDLGVLRNPVVQE